MVARELGGRQGVAIGSGSSGLSGLAGLAGLVGLSGLAARCVVAPQGYHPLHRRHANQTLHCSSLPLPSRPRKNEQITGIKRAPGASYLGPAFASLAPPRTPFVFVSYPDPDSLDNPDNPRQPR